MTRMNLKSKTKLHNKFHFVLTDAKSGQIKQEGWAYNVLTNAGLAALLNVLAGYGSSAPNAYALGQQCFNAWASTIVVGSGDTTPAATDTALAHQEGTQQTGVYHDSEMDIVAKTASHTRKAVWNETLIQNTAIKEVGFKQGSGTLISRALIKDSEGNIITINKGTLDILTVYGTIYMELVDSYSDRVMWVHGAPTTLDISGGAGAAYNGLLSWLAGDGSITYSASSGAYNAFALTIGKNPDDPVHTDQACKELLKSYGSGNATGTDKCIYIDPANRRLVVNKRIAVAEANDAAGIWEFGICMWMYQCGVTTWGSYGWRSLLRAVVPIPGVWTGTTITDEELGTGDSTTTIFQTTWSPVLSGTDVVKVDGVTKTRGTDYTINLATGEITFATAPGTGAAVTCTYGIEQIPKDSNHVLDISFTIQFADGSV